MGRPDYDEGLQLLFSPGTSVVGAVVASLLATLGTLANSLTIAAILLSRLRSHPTSLCLVALGISDLLFCTYNLPLIAHEYFHYGCEFDSCISWELCR